MLSGRYRFRPALWTTIAAAVAIAATLTLGNWQLNRAQEKTILSRSIEARSSESPVQLPASEIAAADLEFRRVEANGEFAPRHTIFLDNKIRDGRVGYEIVTPLKIAASEKYVLVNRGWVQAGASRDQLPKVATPHGEISLVGIAVAPSRKILELSPKTERGAVWQNLVLDRFERVSGLDVQPIVVQQTTDADDGLLREWPRPDTGIDRHRGYAFQWFALSAAIGIAWLALNIERARPI